jgi:hypothetical protein
MIEQNVTIQQAFDALVKAGRNPRAHRDDNLCIRSIRYISRSGKPVAVAGANRCFMDESGKYRPAVRFYFCM